ncbi:hypothetical protein [Sorangium sp. So ce1024]|uniref:hypothetical protein n=1 Tax=Sorangium sp. So ce1024 TaxID=3133327 RepID=UPI003F0F0F76
MFTPRLSQLAAPRSAMPGAGVDVGPVEYVNLPLDPGRVIACVRSGVHLVSSSRRSRRGRGASFRQALEVPLPDEGCRRRLFELYGRGIDLRLSQLDAFVARTKAKAASSPRACSVPAPCRREPPGADPRNR